MAKKIEELMPGILKMLSRGESVSTTQMEAKYKLSASSFREHLRTLRENFFKNDIRYDVDTSDKDFMDIIPTILKYLPKILVLEPDELKDLIATSLDEYKINYT